MDVVDGRGGSGDVVNLDGGISIGVKVAALEGAVAGVFGEEAVAAPEVVGGRGADGLFDAAVSKDGIRFPAGRRPDPGADSRALPDRAEAGKRFRRRPAAGAPRGIQAPGRCVADVIASATIASATSGGNSRAHCRQVTVPKRMTVANIVPEPSAGVRLRRRWRPAWRRRAYRDKLPKILPPAHRSAKLQRKDRYSPV